MRYYQLQVMLEEFLVPKLIDFASSHIVLDTLLKLAGVKTMPEIATFGTKCEDVNLGFNSLTQEDARSLEAFLKNNCGEKNVAQFECYENNVEQGIYLVEVDTASFNKHVLPLIKTAINSLDEEQIREYQKKSETSESIKFYKDSLMEHKFLHSILDQFLALSARSDEFTRGQLDLLFKVICLYVWKLDQRRQDFDFFMDKGTTLKTDYLDDVNDLCKVVIKGSPVLKKDADAKKFRQDLRKFLETAHYHPSLPENLIQKFSLFADKKPAVPAVAAQAEQAASPKQPGV